MQCAVCRDTEVSVLTGVIALTCEAQALLKSSDLLGVDGTRRAVWKMAANGVIWPKPVSLRKPVRLAFQYLPGPRVGHGQSTINFLSEVVDCQGSRQAIVAGRRLRPDISQK